MGQFPQCIPAKVTKRNSIPCPMCREQLTGVSNIFVNMEFSVETAYVCPYMSEISECHQRTLGCNASMTLEQVRSHMIEKHSQSVPCPHCKEWVVGDISRSFEENLFNHITKECTNIPCGGCDRSSNMIGLFFHSDCNGREHGCNSRNGLVEEFAISVNQTCDGKEALSDMCETILRWHYINSQHHSTGRIQFSNDSENVFWSSLIHAFANLHMPTQNATQMMEGLSRATYENYGTAIHQLMSQYAPFSTQTAASVHTMPYVYRIMSIVFNDFQKFIEMKTHFMDVEHRPEAQAFITFLEQSSCAVSTPVMLPM